MRICSLCGRCYETEFVSCEEDDSLLTITREGSPEMIAGYRLEHLLEDTVKGEVYRARQTASGRSCVIRILEVNEEGRPQFLKEAKLAAAFFHPNVVDVYASGALTTGELFVVTEEPDGGSLRELLDNVGVPELLIAIQVVRQAAEALHALHLKGLTHRAVNPENILLTTDAEDRLLVRLKDIDLGGISERSIVSDKFQIDAAINSLKYFAPEQCSGKDASAQTDVYSLGVVFYEMLAGAPPFDGKKAATLIEKHKNQRPPEIKIDNFDLRMLLTHALTESLQKRPDRRQSSADVFARQMRHIEQLATHVSTPPPAGVAPSAQMRPGAVFAASAVAPARYSRPQAPSVVIESPKEPQRKIEIEPVLILKEREPLPVIQAESQSDVGLDTKSEPFPVIDLDVSLSQPQPLLNKPLAPKPPRSWLRSHRKRSRAAASSVIETAKSSPPPSVESRDLELVEPADILPEPEVIAATPAGPKEVPDILVQSNPAKIQWEQPEDDIPSVADVMEVLAQEQIVHMPVVEEQPEEIIVPVRSNPAKVKRIRPIPSPASVQNIRAKQAVTRIPVVQIEPPEEITLVKAPGKRITIELENKRPYTSSIPDEISFSPTILGASRKREEKIDLDPENSMFSAYSHPSRANFADPRVLLVICAGFIGLIAVFLFGEDLVARYGAPGDSDNSVAAQTTSPKEPLPYTAEPNGALPSTKKILKTVERPLSQDDGTDRSKSAPGKASSPISDKETQTSAAKMVGKTPPVVPSTLVISSNNGKIKSKTDPESRVADKKTPAAPIKTAELSRPRIVKNPRP